MRRHLYLIVESPTEERAGCVETTERPRPIPEKDVEGVITRRNLETGSSYDETLVGLGYHDFEDETDYEENFVDVVQRKLGEVDTTHLRKAGLDPQEVTA